MEVVVPPAPADPGLTTPTTADPARPLLRLVLAVVLLAVIVGSSAVAISLLVSRGGLESDDTQATREELMAQTEQFILRSFSYGPDVVEDDGTMPDYRERVTEVITPKFAAEFDESATVAEQLAQNGVERVPDVFGVGVSSVSEDSARVLVAGSFSDNYTVEGKTVRQDPVPFRMAVALVRIDGKWLIDNFDPVSADGDTSEPVLPAPTAPSDGGQGQ